MKEKETEATKQGESDLITELRTEMYKFLIGIYQDNGLTISCKNRERIEDKAALLAKIHTRQALDQRDAELIEWIKDNHWGTCDQDSTILSKEVIDFIEERTK